MYLHKLVFFISMHINKALIPIDSRMGTSSRMAALALTFEDVQGVYVMAVINGDLYSQHTKVLVDRHKRKLLPYKDFYWTLRIETVHI